MKFTEVKTKVRLDQTAIIKYQILTYCFLNGIAVADGELACLAELAQSGKVDLNPFCNDIHSKGIYASAQTVRNSVDKSVAKQLVIKEGDRKKTVRLNPAVKVEIKTPLLYNVITFAT